MKWLQRHFPKQPSDCVEDGRPLKTSRVDTNERRAVELPRDFVEYYSQCRKGEMWVLFNRRDETVLVVRSIFQRSVLLFTSFARAAEYKRGADIAAEYEPLKLEADTFQRCLSSVAKTGVEIGLIDRNPTEYKSFAMLMIRHTLAFGEPVFRLTESPAGEPHTERDSSVDGSGQRVRVSSVEQILHEDAYVMLHLARTMAVWLFNNAGLAESELVDALGKVGAALGLVRDAVEASDARFDKDAVIRKLEQLEHHAMGIVGMAEDALRPVVHLANFEHLLKEIGDGPPIGIGQPKGRLILVCRMLVTGSA